MIVLLGSALFHLVALVGLGWGLACRLTLAPAERLLASAILSGLLLYAIGFGVYLAQLPPAAFRVLPLLTVVSLLAGREHLKALLLDWQGRALVSGLLLICAGCLLLDWTIPNYSNGTWAGDFWEHWLRTRFWLEHGSTDTKFLVIYSVTSRPPLANLETGALLGATRIAYPMFQLEMTVAGVIAFLPAAVLARRWGGLRAIPVMGLLLLVSPVFLAHAQFAWTKLPTVFWVLASLYFFLRSRDADAPAPAPALAGLAMGAAIVAHYSAVPYAAALTLAWIADARRDVAAARRTWRGFLWAILPAAPWVIWTLATYGFAGTFLTNTTVTEAAPTLGGQAVRVLGNVVDTLVPRFWWTKSLGPYLVQESALGYFKDRWFQLFASNFLVSIGVTAWIVAAARLAALARTSAVRGFWAVFIGVSFVLAVAVNGNRLVGGSANVCLVPLSLLGVVFMASQWPALPKAWRILAWAGAVVDFLLGVVLVYFIQSGAYEHFTHPGRSEADWVQTSSEVAILNHQVFSVPDVAFVAGVAPINGWLLASLLLAVLVLGSLWCLRLIATAPAGGEGQRATA